MPDRAASGPLLAARDLVCARGGATILAGLSFSLARGGIVILRGPNGVGKTTLLRTLAGLQPPVAGTLTGGPEATAYAAHSDGLKPTLTVAENLLFWARVFGSRDIDAALAAFDLTPLADRPAQHLSAGQKRRLGLARMLVTRRPVWLMDEPTVSLDTGSVARFAETVRVHCAAGGAAIIASHVDPGLSARTLDLSAFRALQASGPAVADFDEAFL